MLKAFDYIERVFGKSTISLHMIATLTEIPSYISTMENLEEKVSKNWTSILIRMGKKSRRNQSLP